MDYFQNQFTDRHTKFQVQTPLSNQNQIVFWGFFFDNNKLNNKLIAKIFGDLLHELAQLNIKI